MAVRAPGRGGSCGGDSGDEDGLDVEHDACILLKYAGFLEVTGAIIRIFGCIVVQVPVRS